MRFVETGGGRNFAIFVRVVQEARNDERTIKVRLVQQASLPIKTEVQSGQRVEAVESRSMWELLDPVGAEIEFFEPG